MVVLDDLLSTRSKNVTRSAIRELLKMTKKPEVISFAGGIPNPETFPKNGLAESAREVILEKHHKSLQYGTTEGLEEFRKEMLNWLGDFGFQAELEETLTTTASQQAIDLVSKTFLDPGDVLFCGLPTYLGAVQSFSVFQAQSVGIPLEEDGMNLEALEEKIQKYQNAGENTKFIYVVPDFQNPSGVTMSETKRKRLLQIAKDYDLLIFEDSPYLGLKFSGDTLTPIWSLDQSGRVISTVTTSKFLSSGMRLAILMAEEKIIDQLIKMKQASDLCTPTLTQWIAADWLKNNDMNEHLKPIQARYKRHRDAMLEALEKYFPDREDIEWTHPEGGLFFWVTLPETMDAGDLFQQAVEENVAFVPGENFYVNDQGKNTMRLSFSATEPEKIEKGIKRLAKVVEESLPLEV